jgi:hypothetical protein
MEATYSSETSVEFQRTMQHHKLEVKTLPNHSCKNLWLGFLATDPEVRVLFPALPDFLRSSGSGKGSTKPLSTIEELLGRKNSGSCLEKQDYGRRGSFLQI